MISLARILAVTTATTLLGMVAACHSSSGTSSSGSDASTAQAPSAAKWKTGGRDTGPWPPTGSASAHWGPTWPLGSHTSSNGYRSVAIVQFGPPLHYQIPYHANDCPGGVDGYGNPVAPQDLPPGQYMVPFKMTTTNKLQQQAPAAYPLLSATIGTSDNPVPGMPAANPAQISGDGGSWLTWADGKCQGDVYQVLGPGGSASAYGWVGPATASELRRIEIYADWGGQEDTGKHAPLVALLPNRATPSN